MEAIYPDVRADSARPGPGRTETLSCVSNYQFGWHITYPYADDVAPLLPAGTIIHIISWHDNTANNKYNPNPKNWVGYGQRSIDEMSFAWVTLTYLDEADFQQRVQARNEIAMTALLIFLLAGFAASDRASSSPLQLGSEHRAVLRGLDPESRRHVRPCFRVLQPELEGGTRDSPRPRQ